MCGQRVDLPGERRQHGHDVRRPVRTRGHRGRRGRASRHAAARGPARSRRHPRCRPCRVVCRRTATAEADAVVIGARRRSLPVGAPMGHVSHAVLHHAHCPAVPTPLAGQEPPE
ncbi:universal stress protein [Streptomyces sp. NPDC053707]